MDNFHKKTFKVQAIVLMILLVIIAQLNSFSQDPPEARCGHSITKVDGEIYMYGGSTTIIEYKNSEKNERVVLGSLWQWDESQKEWAKKKPANFPLPRSSHSANSNNKNGTDKLYIFFGTDSIGGTHSDIWSYDPATNIWNQEPSSGSQIPDPRQLHTSSTINGGNILVFGGITQDGGIDGNTWIYDPSNGIWSMGSPFPDMFRYGQSAVSTGGNVYVYGGMGPVDASDKMWEYNEESGQWILKSGKSIGSKDLPTGRYHHAMVVSEEHNKIWILGGSTTFDDELSDVWEYDITLNSWTQLADLPMPRTMFSAALYIEDNQPGEIVLFGGVSNSIVIEESYTYPLTITEISETPVSFQLFENYPNPFKGTTEIEFHISAPSQITLDVYNILGEKVTCLLNEAKNTGKHKVLFDASELLGGIYFIKLQIDGKSHVKKCIIMQ